MKQSVNNFYKQKFGQKVYKLSLDAGCTCPTRDGTKDTKGCIFCSQAGSGDFTSDRRLTVTQQIQQAKKLIENKMPKNCPSGGGLYIAYFQNFTNTYGDLTELSKKWKEALACEGIVGLALGTRPDCINNEVLQVLEKISREYFVQVELGFQTCDENTAEYIRRHFSNEVYFDAVERIHKVAPAVHVVTHIIFGLPFENEIQMMNSVKAAVNAGTDGIKIASLYVLQGTDLAEEYRLGKFEVLQKEEYFELLQKALEIIPENIIIHRLTGDPPKKLLIAPQWPANKKAVLNDIKKIFPQN